MDDLDKKAKGVCREALTRKALVIIQDISQEVKVVLVIALGRFMF